MQDLLGRCRRSPASRGRRPALHRAGGEFALAEETVEARETRTELDALTDLRAAS